MVAALGVAVMFSRAPQSVDSQASVKKGIVTVNLTNTTTTNVVNQPVNMLVMIDTKQALINNASLGIRFQGSHVKDVKYLPAPTDIFNLTQKLVTGGDSDSGINLSMMSATGKSKAFPTGYVLGTLSFVPTSAGPLNIYFDPNVSHVYQATNNASPTPKPTMMPPMTPTPTPSPYVTARPVPSYAPGTEFPHTQTQQTVIIGDPQPSARPMLDILQTPESVSLMIMSGIPTTAPTPSPVISCDPTGKCPPGYSCVQPTMPPCPAGMMCPQVMPARQCVPMMPTVKPTSMPTHYPSPRPTSLPTYRPTPYPSSRPTSYPTPRPTTYPVPSYRPYSPVPNNR